MSGDFFDPDLFVLPPDAGTKARMVGGLAPMPTDFPAAEPAPNGDGSEGERSSWERIDLTDPQYAIPAEPPVILGLLYAGKRHVVSGPPESAKTLVAYILLLSAIRDGNTVAIIDFEMGPASCRRLLDDLGCTLEEMRGIYYVEPDQEPEDELACIIGHSPALVLIDALAGAYDVSNLDDNDRGDAERFARTWVRPLWKHGIATVLIDHVTKNADTRGKFTIGSERKVGQADVHLSLDALKPLSRGHTGMVKVTAHKDRPGFLERPTALVVDLTSHPDTNRISWATRDPHPTDETTGQVRPTTLMEKVSRHLEHLTQPASRNQIEEHVKGKREYVRIALETLTHEGYAEESAGPRNSRLFRSTKPYRTADDVAHVDDKTTSPDDLAPTSPPLRPGEDKTDLALPPFRGVAGRGRSGELASSPRPAGSDETKENEIERLLEKYDKELGEP